MAITYGPNMARLGVAQRLMPTVLMKAYTTYAQKSDVFVSYRHKDQATAISLAQELSDFNWDVFIDVHDDTLSPGDNDLDDSLVKAIINAITMIIVVSDDTQGSWWVPWEIGVATPFGKPRAMYKPTAVQPLPSYLDKLERLRSPLLANLWVLRNKFAIKP